MGHKDNELNARNYYENVEITVASGGGAQQLSTLGTTFQSKFKNDAADGDYATMVTIRTSQTISVQLNSTSYDSITVTSTDSPFEISGIKIQDMWITNSSGSPAAVRLFFQPTKY